MIHARKDYQQRIQDSAGLIPDDEPVLLIRGQDAAAIAAGRAWVKKHLALGGDPEVALAVAVHLLRVEAWQTTRVCKVADVPAEAL